MMQLFLSQRQRNLRLCESLLSPASLVCLRLSRLFSAVYWLTQEFLGLCDLICKSLPYGLLFCSVGIGILERHTRWHKKHLVNSCEGPARCGPTGVSIYLAELDLC